MTGECLFCGKTAVDVLERETRMTRSAFNAQVLRCRRCRLVFAWPRPADAETAYEAQYFQAHGAAGLVQVGEAHLERFGRRLRRVSPEPGRLLEIGVGHGGFLRLAKQLGWDVVGLDVSHWAADQVRRRHNVQVIAGSITDPDFATASFDLVHMSHVLEHVPDPLRVLSEVRRVLKPNGHLIIEVPNELENLYTWARLRSATARPYPVQSTHLWFFSPPTLRRVVRSAGFDIDQARSFRDVDDARPVRRIGKRLVSALERLVECAPLIEVVARPQGRALHFSGNEGP